MQALRPDFARRVRAPAYLIMALLVLSPLIELCAAAWPFDARQAGWRLSFAGTAGASLGWPLLGLFLTFLIAVLVADTTALLVVSSFSTLVGVLCFFQAALFALDALEMKTRVRPAMSARYDAVSAWWVLKFCAAGAILVLLSVSAWRVARTLRRERKAGADKSALIVKPSAPPSRVAASASP